MGVEGIGPSEEELGIKPTEVPTEADAINETKKQTEQPEEAIEGNHLIRKEVETLAKGIVERTGIEVRDARFLAEANLAGRSAYALARMASRQEKRPVFVINNARQGAFLQLGFPHWLANFRSQEQAEEFIAELNTDNNYTRKSQELDRKIHELREILRKRLPELNNSKLDRNFRSGYFPDEKKSILTALEYADPSADVFLEIKTLAVHSRGEISDSEQRYLSKVSSEGRIPNPEYQADQKGHDKRAERRFTEHLFEQKLNILLTEIFILKDELRAVIMQQAQGWLNNGQIDNFVYSVNHYKKSSGGGDEGEGNAFQTRKFLATIAEPSTLVFTNDVHNIYFDNPEDYATYTLNSEILASDRSAIGAGGQILNVNRIHTVLDYPQSMPEAAKPLTGHHRDILHRIADEKPKVIDTWVIAPLQRTWRSRFDTGGQYPITGGELDTAEKFTNPYSLRLGYRNQSSREREGIRLMRTEIERLKRNPSWLREEMPKIFHEANYTFGGPEDEEFLGEVEIEEGKKNE